MAKKQTPKIKSVKCVDCNKKTTNYYTSSINSGKISRCSNCHELWIIRSTRYDSRYIEIGEK
jgi:NAD-dependent SIR2 family protein deacetylase